MKPEHWAAQHERGHAFFLQLTAWIVKYLPMAVVRVCTAVVCAYFYATSATQRRHIHDYQTRLKRHFPDCRLPEKWAVYQQFAAFGEAIADRFAVWQQKIQYRDLILDDPDNVYAAIRQKGARGEIFICSHLGNVEICRALVSHHQGFKMNVLVHNQHAKMFNQALKKAGASDINLIQVNELDAEKMLQLAQRLEAGEWLAIAADRVPVRGDKTVNVSFLGFQAAFPQGVWLLAHLLKAKTNTLFVLKKNGRYHLILRRFADAPDWKRHERATAIAQSAQRYADELAHHAAQVPLQWFHFYSFWDAERE